MQKISTVQARGKRILKEQLTIGLDLGDRCSSYCVLNEAGEIVLEEKSADDTGSDEENFRQDAEMSHRDGDRNALSVGEPALDGAGARSNCGARA